MPVALQLKNNKFGKLTVIHYIYTKAEHRYWKCKCDCGNNVNVVGSHLVSGHTTSCGCIKKYKGRNLASRNGMWKGKGVGYSQLHNWVKSRLPKPKVCQKCNKNLPYDLANLGIYNRDLKNWIWLCRKCHMISDGRLNKFRQLNKKCI